MPEAVPKLRITRPYGSEDELIDGDFASLSRAWIILPDVAMIPVGQLVRFEVLLSSGAPAIRGEGTVSGYHAPGGAKPPGLEVKFSRIDARTKSILLRVHAKRMALAHSPSEPPARASLEPPPPPPADAASVVDLPKEELSDVHAAPAPMHEPATDPTPPPAAARAVAAPPNRNEILDRLRERARNLPPEKRFDRQRGA